jgi:Tol biopolymer transport system component
MSVTLISVSYAQEGDVHFHGGVDPKTDFVHHGDTLTFYGWSNAYQSWKPGIIPTPFSSFDVKIYDPDNNAVFEQNLNSDENGKVEFSIPITADFKQGKYIAKITITNGGYAPFYDEEYFYVILQESDVLSDSKYVLFLSAEQSAKFGTYPKFFATICPLPFDVMSGEAFLDPETRTYMENSQILVNAYITKPDGTKSIEPFAYIGKPFDCSDKAENQFYTDMEGMWTIYVVAKWMNNGTIYKTQSNNIEVFVPAPMFRGSQIEMLDVGISSTSGNFGALDWSPDSRYLLLTYQVLGNETYYDKFAIFDLEFKTLKNLTALDRFYSEDQRITDAKFSPDGNGVYFAYDKKIHLYDTTQETITETDTSEVSNFDVDQNNNIFYTKEPSNTGKSNPEIHLYKLDANSGKTEEITKHKDFWEFDVNDEGTEILYRKTIDAGYGWADRKLAIYDIQSKTHKTIPKIDDADCGELPIFAPNDDLIIYDITGCGRGWPGGVLLITDINGNSEVLIPSSNHRPGNPVISPDGQYLVYTHGDYSDGTGGLYKMTLAKSVLEFGTISVLVLVVSISIIVISVRFSRSSL